MANAHVEAALGMIQRILSDCNYNAEVNSYLLDVRAELEEALAGPYEPDVEPAVEGDDESDGVGMFTSYDA